MIPGCSFDGQGGALCIFGAGRLPRHHHPSQERQLMRRRAIRLNAAALLHHVLISPRSHGICSSANLLPSSFRSALGLRTDTQRPSIPVSASSCSCADLRVLAVQLLITARQHRQSPHNPAKHLGLRLQSSSVRALGPSQLDFSLNLPLTPTRPRHVSLGQVSGLARLFRSSYLCNSHPSLCVNDLAATTRLRSRHHELLSATFSSWVRPQARSYFNRHTRPRRLLSTPYFLRRSPNQRLHITPHKQRACWQRRYHARHGREV